MEMIGRYELKFPLIDKECQKTFLEAALPELEEDPFSDKALYRVSSQYFDTDDYRAYWEKLDGEALRKKYRLRFYSHDSKEGEFTAFMEIKHRIDNRVYKERVRLTTEGAEAILSDSEQLKHIMDHVVPEDRDKKTTLHNLESAAQIPSFRARNVITYIREAYVGKNNHRLRVTLDHSCRSLNPQSYLDASLHKGKIIVPENKSVLEIKFNHGIPRWIRDIVGEQGLDLRRFSKYAAGVEALGLVAKAAS